MYAGEYKTLKTRAVCDSLRFDCPSISVQYFTFKLPSSLGFPESPGYTGDQINMAKTGKKSRKRHGTNRDARPRKKVRMCEEGTTGKQTAAVEEARIRAGTVYLSDGVLVFMVDGEWHRVPNELWAWTPSRIIYRRCHECSFRDDCQHPYWSNERVCSEPAKEYEYTAWTRQPLRAAEVRQTLLSAETQAPLSIPPLLSGVWDVATTASEIPPELFRSICGSVDDAKLARTCRLVCRYWEKQCRSAAFRFIDLTLETKVFDLVHFKRDSAWQHIPQLVEEVKLPKCTSETQAPWMHLLDPRWKRDELVIEGPFPVHRTLRSIYTCGARGLPRSPPVSVSRGFTRVHLSQVRFNQFEDTTCLASELPDLEQLVFSRVRWYSLPTEVPRRRPRANRNVLTLIKFNLCSVTGVESPSFVFAAWTLVLGVSHSSYLDSLNATSALIQAADSSDFHIVTVKRDCEGHVSGLDIGSHLLVLALRYRFEQSTEKHLFFVSLDHTSMHRNLPLWSKLKSAIALLPQSWHFHLLFGFASRAKMLHFAEDVVALLVGRGEVRYAISQREEREDDSDKDYWYEATLDSKELKGKGVYHPVDVYADWQKIFQPTKQAQNATQFNAA